MIATFATYKNRIKEKFSLKGRLIIVVLAILIAGVIVWQTTQPDLIFSKSYQKDENYLTLQVKAEAQTTGKDPCNILDAWLVEAKLLGDTQRVQDIIQAQKFLGCRNLQKRKDR